MLFQKRNYFYLLLSLSNVINSFFILPFETIFIKDESIKADDYYDKLFQNELYSNLSLSIPLQNIKTLIKMDSSGFILYEGAFEHNSSTSIEKGVWDTRVGWLWRQNSFPAKDFFYFTRLNSYKDLDKSVLEGDKEDHNKIRTNKTSFIVVYKKTQSITSNKNFFYYGLIGLKLVENSYFSVPEFVVSLRKTRDINSYTFFLEFNQDNYTYKNYFNNDNKGYLIVGEELTDDNNEKNKISYTDAQKNGKYIGWYVKFDNIISKFNYESEQTNKNYSEFRAKVVDAEFCVNLPYLIGTTEYLEYINQTFFEELTKQELCYFNTKNNKKSLYSFICNGTSEIVRDYLYNKFPNLTFEHKELQENFTLTKYDLFSYNNFNSSDTNIYFLIMFPPLHGLTNYHNWVLGVPLFKKYRLSFNYDTKKIGYYKSNQHKNEKNNSSSLFNNKIFQIGLVIILIIIVFILGMLYQKKCFGIRKKKAVELNDNYDYDPYHNIDNAINDDH